jgi:hypothetical protein
METVARGFSKRPKSRLWARYLAGGVKTSRRDGSGLGFGLGAFLTSFLPLSLFPMKRSLPQKLLREKSMGTVRNPMSQVVRRKLGPCL